MGKKGKRKHRKCGESNKKQLRLIVTRWEGKKGQSSRNPTHQSVFLVSISSDKSIGSPESVEGWKLEWESWHCFHSSDNLPCSTSMKWRDTFWALTQEQKNEQNRDRDKRKTRNVHKYELSCTFPQTSKGELIEEGEVIGKDCGVYIIHKADGIIG